MDDSIAGFDFPAAEVERIAAPFVHRRVAIDADEWRELVAWEERLRGVSRLYWKRRLLGWRLPRRAISETVEKNYDGIWAGFDFAKAFEPAGNPMPHEWRGQGLLANAAVTARLHHAALAKVIRLLRPRTVLEVGSGLGANLLVLSNWFPEISFRGVELTESGVDAARAFAAAPRLPDVLLRFMPDPPADAGGHQRIVFERGSAEALPFAAAEFDLVFTRLALEQMEAIRHRALSEIARVTRSHAVMIEPFREMNGKGLSRRYVVGNHYFQGSISELSRYGLAATLVFSDWPHKITLHPVLVVARRQAAADRALKISAD